MTPNMTGRYDLHPLAVNTLNIAAVLGTETWLGSGKGLGLNMQVAVIYVMYLSTC